MKLWDKGYDIDRFTEEFTIGKDRELDVMLAKADVLGNMAHLKMLHHIGLISDGELKDLAQGLKDIFAEIEQGKFHIEAGIEDIHSQIECLLTRKCGEAGKKIHTGRSRNDQVLTDLKLFTRTALIDVLQQVTSLFHLLMEKAEANKDILMPGYTHLQIAMPSSFGMWFSAYAESLADDLLMLKAAYDMVNTNPLGSGAGYGSSVPLNRTMTTRLLGFGDLAYNSVYAQMQRGKMEKKDFLYEKKCCDAIDKTSSEEELEDQKRACLLVEILVFSDFPIGLPPVPVLCLIRKTRISSS